MCRPVSHLQSRHQGGEYSVTPRGKRRETETDRKRHKSFFALKTKAKLPSGQQRRGVYKTAHYFTLGAFHPGGPLCLWKRIGKGVESSANTQTTFKGSEPMEVTQPRSLERSAPAAATQTHFPQQLPVRDGEDDTKGAPVRPAGQQWAPLSHP